MTPGELGTLDQGQRNYVLTEMAWLLDYFGVVTRRDWDRIYRDIKGQS